MLRSVSQTRQKFTSQEHRALSFTVLLFVGAFLVARNANAKPQQFQVDNANVEFEVPQGWQAAKDVFGLPLVLLGPPKQGSRPVIYLSNTGIDGLKFDSASLERNQKEYRSQREKWLEEFEGTSLQYFPYRKEVWPTQIEVHQIGYRYRASGVDFSERSYFALCQGRLFHMKSLLRSGHLAEFEALVDKTIHSFRCKTKG